MRKTWKVYGDIGYVLGPAPVNALLPLALGTLLVWASNATQSAWLASLMQASSLATFIAATLFALVVFMGLALVVMPVTGLIILRRIETKHGSEARQNVYDNFAAITDSKPVNGDLHELMKKH